MDIDLVYIFQDDNDIELYKEKESFAKKFNSLENFKNDIHYLDDEHLKFSLRSVEKYAPWVNKIHIVTNKNIPKWLNKNNSKINIVNVDEIVPKEYLPCYSKNTIEAFIDNINDLSEYFLLCEQDTFLTSNVSKDDFFDENLKPIINLRKIKKSLKYDIYQKSIFYTLNFFFNHTPPLLNEDIKECELASSFTPFVKSNFIECKNKFKDEFLKLYNYRFISPDILNSLIFSLYNIHCADSSFKINPSISDEDLFNQLDIIDVAISSSSKIKDKIILHSPKFLSCKNSKKFSSIHLNNLKGVLSELYNFSSSFEKEAMPVIKPIYKDKNSYAIVFAFNDEFSKYFSITLKSIILNSKKNEKYDIIIFCDYVKESSLSILSSMLPDNFSIRTYNILSWIKERFPDFQMRSRKNWLHIIYHRIFIPFLMQSYKKVLYLDSDIAVNQNLSYLFKEKFNKNQILAIKDSTAQLLHMPEYKERLDYLKNYLGLKKPDNYFNSGVMMFNIENINLAEYEKNIINASKLDKLLFPDQDILNIVFEDKVKYLSYRWNFCSGQYFYNENYIKNSFLPEFRKEYDNALKSFAIIHFSSPKKPWKNNLNKYNAYFWKIARQTPFYEEILFERFKEYTLQLSKNNAKYTNLYVLLNNEKKRNILLWGASIFLNEFNQRYDITNKNILGIIDSDVSKCGLYVDDWKIYSPFEIEKINPDLIIVTIVNRQNQRLDEIKDFLKRNCKKEFEIIAV